MVTCTKCGSENAEDAAYCAKCGARLEKREHVAVEPSREARPESGCFGLPPRPEQRERADFLGLMSGGVILIVLALTYLRYPLTFSIIVDYLENLASRQGYIKPPLVLFGPVIFFLYAVGVWGLILSALRVVLQGRVRGAVGDLIGGLFAFFCAYLLTSYANDAITGRGLLAYFIMAIGLIVIINAVIYFAYPERRKD